MTTNKKGTGALTHTYTLFNTFIIIGILLYLRTSDHVRSSRARVERHMKMIHQKAEKGQG
jgi:hypothetical protein